MSTTLLGPDAYARTAAPAPRRRRLAWPPAIALLLFGVVGLVALLPTRPEPASTVLARRELRPVARPDGAIDLVDGAGALADRVPAEGDSFVRGVLSGVGFQRRRHGVPADGPLVLTALDNGRVVLADPGTGTSIDLEAFGPDNLRSFARLLQAPNANPTANPTATPEATR